MRLATAAVLVLAGVGLGWGLYGNTASPLSIAADPGAQPDGVAPVVLTPPRRLQSLGGLSGLFEQMRRKFGDTTGYRMVVFPEYGSLDRPDPAHVRRTLSYSYRGGWGDPATGRTSSDAVAVDLAAFDLQTAIAVLRGAAQTLGINPAEVSSTYLIVEPGRDPTAPGAVSVSVYVSGDSGGGHIELAPDGSVKRIQYP